MKIVLFIPSLQGGGAERMFVNMATWFVNNGHFVDLVLMNAANQEYRGAVSDRVRIIDLNTPRLWTSLPAFRRYLNREKPDIVISAMPLANGIAAWAKRTSRYSPPLILTERNAVSIAFGDLDVCRYRPLMWAIRASYRFADALVGVSLGVTERLRQIPGVSATKVHTIYNPAWSPEIGAKALEPVSHPWYEAGDPPVVLAVGRLVPQKDFTTLLRAFAKVRVRRKVRLIILGEGSERQMLAALARSLGINDDVSMPGFLQNPFTQMARANVFVQSSIHEGFGNVLVETMACGTPVVSTDCPSGPSEILEGGRYGILTPVGDADAMAAAIERQLDDPTPSDLLKARAKEFSVEASAEAYLTLIERLVKKS